MLSTRVLLVLRLSKVPGFVFGVLRFKSWVRFRIFLFFQPPVLSSYSVFNVRVLVYETYVYLL